MPGLVAIAGSSGRRGQKITAAFRHIFPLAESGVGRLRWVSYPIIRGFRADLQHDRDIA